MAAAIRERLEQMAGSELSVTLWPKASQDVPDTRQLKLAVLSPQQVRPGAATTGFVEELPDKAGTAFRTHRNALVILVPDAAEAAALRERVKRSLALRAIQDDKALVRQLSEENRETLKSKLKDAEGDIPFQVLSAYRHLAKAGETGVDWLDLGLPTVGEKGPLARRVRQYLKSQELLVDKLAPHRLLEKALRPDEPEKPLAEIVEAFHKYPHLPMLESEAVVSSAVAQGWPAACSACVSGTACSSASRCPSRRSATTRCCCGRKWPRLPREANLARPSRSRSVAATGVLR